MWPCSPDGGRRRSGSGPLREVGLGGAAAIRRQIVAVERPGARADLAVLDDAVGSPRADPELIPRALPITAVD